MVKRRPASTTSARPLRSISSCSLASSRRSCDGSAGAPMVATARTDVSRGVAQSTAAPPSECPTSSAGASISCSRNAAAATRSSTLPPKVLSANSPSLSPSPVKSNRSTAIWRSARARLTCTAAFRSLEQVKQWANSAVARGAPSAGRSETSGKPLPVGTHEGDGARSHDRSGGGDDVEGDTVRPARRATR